MAGMAARCKALRDVLAEIAGDRVRGVGCAAVRRVRAAGQSCQARRLASTRSRSLSPSGSTVLTTTCVASASLFGRDVSLAMTAKGVYGNELCRAFITDDTLIVNVMQVGACS